MKFNVEVKETIRYYLSIDAEDMESARIEVGELFISDLKNKCYNSCKDVEIVEIEESGE